MSGGRVAGTTQGTDINSDMNVTQLPVVAGIEITTDQDGRYNLNALHRASGLGPNKAPAQWLRTESARKLVQLAQEKTMQKCIVSKDGRGGGTFAHENVATEYAGWINTEFRWIVNQTFIDYRTGNLQQPTLPKSLPEALRMAADLAEENTQLRTSHTALNRLAHADGDYTPTVAAKSLQIGRKQLFTWLDKHR